MTEVELVGGAIRIPSFAEDDDVVTLTERVGEDVDGAQVDIGVIPGSLAGRGTIEVPFRELIDGGGRFREGLDNIGKKWVSQQIWSRARVIADGDAWVLSRMALTIQTKTYLRRTL